MLCYNHPYWGSYLEYRIILFWIHSSTDELLVPLEGNIYILSRECNIIYPVWYKYITNITIVKQNLLFI